MRKTGKVVGCDLIFFKDVLYSADEFLKKPYCCDLMFFKDVLY